MLLSFYSFIEKCKTLSSISFLPIDTKNQVARNIFFIPAASNYSDRGLELQLCAAPRQRWFISEGEMNISTRVSWETHLSFQIKSSFIGPIRVVCVRVGGGGWL